MQPLVNTSDCRKAVRLPGNREEETPCNPS